MSEVTLFTGEEIYRPFWEEDSALLEVELGCSWHKCRFCDFARDPFRLFSLEDIEEKSRLLVPYAKGKKRIFLLGENPLVLDTQKLLTIFGYIEKYMPWIEEISMYARFDDILRKGIEELTLLREKGLVHLHIGLESGNDDVLRMMNKGITAEQGKIACGYLHQVGITFSLSAIPGLGGVELSNAHARDTADFLNTVKPARVWMIGLLVWPDTPLEAMCKNGTFHPLSLRERLVELQKIVQRLELVDCLFTDTTVLNEYTLVGNLPDDKGKLLYWIEELLRRSQ